MATLGNKMKGLTHQATALSVHFDNDNMYVSLTDGRAIKVPVSAYKRLRDATPEQREQYELIARGTGIHWEAIDEDLSVSGLIRDFELNKEEPEYERQIRQV